MFVKFDNCIGTNTIGPAILQFDRDAIVSISLEDIFDEENKVTLYRINIILNPSTYYTPTFTTEGIRLEAFNKIWEQINSFSKETNKFYNKQGR